MSKRMLVLMCSIFLIVPLLFMGCSGDDGVDRRDRRDRPHRLHRAPRERVPSLPLSVSSLVHYVMTIKP